MPEPEYHAHPALSQSLAKLLLPPSVPAKFLWARENPAPPKKEFDFGHAAHALVLGEGMGVEILQVTAKDGSRTDAENRRAKSTQEHEAAAREAGNIPLLRSEAGRVEAMADAIKRHPVASVLLSSGAAEQSVFWTDERGVDRRARFDHVPDLAVPAVTDYKTTTDASPGAFAKSVAGYRYHFQAAWYVEAAAAAELGHVEFALIAQEKEPPYLVGVYQPSVRAIERGRDLVARALDIYQQCTETGVWPGYSPDIEPLDLPEWAYREDIA
nr:PD-(D/E)XK nuclease-like domain-containing protein [Nakamurella aerolata]